MKRRRDSQRKKSEKRTDKGNLQRGSCNGEAITGDYSITNNMSPRMGGVRRECNPENIYQVSLNSGHDDMRGERGRAAAEASEAVEYLL